MRFNSRRIDISARKQVECTVSKSLHLGRLASSVSCWRLLLGNSNSASRSHSIRKQDQNRRRVISSELSACFLESKLERTSA